MSWFKVETSITRNAKAQSLSGDLFKTWINLLAMFKEYGCIPSAKQIAYELRQPVDVIEGQINGLIEAGLLDFSGDGETVKPHDWEKYQPKDLSTARVQAWRSRNKEKQPPVSETVRNAAKRDETPRNDGNADKKRVEEIRVEESRPKTCGTDVPRVEVEEQSSQEGNRIKAEKRELTEKQKSWFERWWANYWRKVDRRPAWEAFQKLIVTEEIFNGLVKATERQRGMMLAREPDKRPYGATFVRKRPWEDGEVYEIPLQRKKRAIDEYLEDLELAENQ